ncbi:hypothetical protein EDD17DRAFT_1769384 [Pisolithus thermaeus]|nr:hypothetical protein EDD17DRAFT_1769384 [Pisolithus thermaeus]
MANPMLFNQLAAQELASSSSTHGHGQGHGHGHGRGQGCGHGRGHGHSSDPNIWARTARLISWCKTYPDSRIKLFSDSHQEVVNEGQWRQQMSAQKEVYFQQVADAVFTHNHNLHIWQLYAQYPSVFVKPIKILNFQLISHFRLCKKYNNANKTLGTTGTGLTAMELRENPEMKRLLDKIVNAFPWCTANPGQDFTTEAQQYFSGEKGSMSKEQLPLGGNGWTLGNEDTAGEEDEEVECNNKDLYGHNTLAYPQVAVTPSINADDNIDPMLHLISTPQCDSPVSAGPPTSPPASIFSKATDSSMPVVSKIFSQPVLANVESPSTTGVPSTQSSLTLQGTSTTSFKKDKGKARAAADVKSLSLNIPARPVENGCRQPQ